MDFKKNFSIENLQINSEPTIIYKSINDFIMLLDSKFYAIQLLKSQRGRRKEKNMIVS